jgi:hypothetical protein
MFKEKLNKKGELNNVLFGVLGVMLIAILVVTSLYLFGSLQDSLPDYNSTIVLNETVLGQNTSDGAKVNGAATCGFTSFSVLAVNPINISTVVINTANYTVTSNGRITNTTGGFYNNYAWNVSYSFANSGTGCSAIESASTGFSNSIGLIGVLLAVTLVVGVLAYLGYMVMMKRTKA